MPAFRPEQFCPTTVTVNVCMPWTIPELAARQASALVCGTGRYQYNAIRLLLLLIFRFLHIQLHSYWCSRERYGICVRISRIALCTSFADNIYASQPTIKRVLDHDCSGILPWFVLLDLRFSHSFVHLNSSVLAVLCFWVNGCNYWRPGWLGRCSSVVWTGRQQTVRGVLISLQLTQVSDSSLT